MLRFLKYFIMLLFTLLLFSACNKIEKKDKIVNIIFRYDDASVYTSSSLESKILTIFEEHNLSLTFAVIPYRCTGSPLNMKNTKVLAYPKDKADFLKKYIDNGTLDVALHGYSHQTVSDVEWTEFKNVPYKAQLNKLSTGKILLEKRFNTGIHSFVPPYNTYDTHTIKALEALDIKILSADLNGPKPQSSKLVFISNTTTINKVQLAINEALEKDVKESSLVVMFHEYNFSTTPMPGVDKAEITFSTLDTLLTNLQNNPHVNILSLTQAYQKIHKQRN